MDRSKDHGQHFEKLKIDLKRIEFVSAKHPDAYQIAQKQQANNATSHQFKHRDGDMTRPRGKGPHAGPGGVKELFREQDLVMRWSQLRRVGAGLANLGNTCFMNSVLQCLMHTPPLAELLLSDRPVSGAPRADGFDPVKMTRELLQEALRSRQGYVAPRPHAKTLKKVCRSFRPGRQEDAHEYLIALLDAMHERSLAGLSPRPPPAVEFTSFVYRIFGGRIRSQVKCAQCGYESNTYDPFLDLSLEITHAASVDRALQRFTAAEVLDGSNKYRCPRENRAVRAEKRMTVEAAPAVLIVQLKRFEFSLSGRKISKPVAFHHELDLTPAMSRRPADPVLYDLYGVLVHQGHSMHSGHYFCFVKGAGGEWHKCDDQRVCTTSVRNVLGQHPYILFYTRRAAGAPPRSPPAQGRNAFGPVPQPSAAPSAPVEAALPAKKAKRKQQQPATLANGIAAVAAGGKQLQPPKLREAPHPPAASAGVQPLANGGGKFVALQAAAARRRQQELERAQQEEADLASAVRAAEEAAALAGSSSRAAKRARRGDDSAQPSGLPRPRQGVLTMSPSAMSMGRRGKRLEEQKMLLLSQMSRHAKAPASAARKRRRPGANGLIPSSPPTVDQDGPMLALAAEPPLTRRRVASFVEEMAPNGAASNLDIDSAIFAPDWPPRTDATAAALATAAADPAPPLAAPVAEPPATKRRAAREEVGGFLQAEQGGAAGKLGVDAWETVEPENQRQHDRLLRRAGAQRRPLDEYDADYDVGKRKKVRDKSRGRGSLDGGTFDAAFKAKQAAPRVHGKPPRQQQQQQRRQQQQRQRRA